jgi:adenylate cyclase
MQTCLQVLGLGWREGMAAQEAQRWFEEARDLALAAKNPRANAWSHAGYGRILAARGSAEEYVSRVREALVLSAEADDRSSVAMLKAVLAQAERLTGNLDTALEVNIEATGLLDDISPFDRQLFNFDLDRWLTAMRAQVLVQLGRFDEARPYLDRMLQTDLDPNDITLHLAHVAYVDMASAQGNAALAATHAERALVMAKESGSPYIHVSALACLGVSHLMSGRFEEAANELEKAISFARSRNAGLESEARLLTDLATAYRLAGDLEKAGRTVHEAIEVATARAARVSQCLARLVHAEIALQAADPDRAELELGNAQALMEQTGARIHENRARDLAAHIHQHRIRVDHPDPPRPG